MAVYKIFPEKDTTIYSAFPYTNTGRDEIIETSTNPDIFTGSNGPQTSRILIKFSDSQINDVITNKVLGNSFNVYLKLFLANASNIPLDYTIFCYPLSQSWDMGTGKYGDDPITTDGASWKTPRYSGSSFWYTTLGNYATASYISSNIGGGVWYTGSSTLNPVASQSFNYITSKDIILNVTNAINLFVSGTIPNNGFILKKQDSLEFNSSSYFDLKYYMQD